MSDKERREKLDGEVKRKADADLILGSYLHKETWNVIEMHLFERFQEFY